MGTNSFLRFQPQQLNFQFELNKQLSSSILLVNDSQNYVAFKLKTTNPEKYGVQPRIGIIDPRSSSQITVKMRAVRKVPPNMRCKDKFMIQSLIANSAATTPLDAQNLFNEESAHLVQECKLPVVYSLLPLQPPRVKSLAMDNPAESSLVTSEPSDGIVLPPSTSNATERLQEQSKVPSIMQGEDKFPIHGEIASSSPTTEEIISDTFGKSGSVVEECEVRVIKILEAAKNRIHSGELIPSGIFVILLCLVAWYLMKQTISMIWSFSMLIMMLVIKMIQKLVSESLEDWVVKTLLCIFTHLLLKCKETLRLP